MQFLQCSFATNTVHTHCTRPTRCNNNLHNSACNSHTYPMYRACKLFANITHYLQIRHNPIHKSCTHPTLYTNHTQLSCTPQSAHTHEQPWHRGTAHGRGCARIVVGALAEPPGAARRRFGNTSCSATARLALHHTGSTLGITVAQRAATHCHYWCTRTRRMGLHMPQTMH